MSESYPLPGPICRDCRPGVVRALVPLLDALDGRDLVARLRACPELGKATDVIDGIEAAVDRHVEKHAAVLQRFSRARA